MNILFVPKLNNNMTVSELIVSILSEDFPLTIKALHFRITKAYGKNVSYQAVFKALKHLSKNNVIQRHGRFYFLSSEWIYSLKEFSLQLEEKYRDLSKQDLIAEQVLAAFL